MTQDRALSHFSIIVYDFEIARACESARSRLASRIKNNRASSSTSSSLAVIVVVPLFIYLLICLFVVCLSVCFYVCYPRFVRPFFYPLKSRYASSALFLVISVDFSLLVFFLLYLFFFV